MCLERPCIGLREGLDFFVENSLQLRIEAWRAPSMNTNNSLGRRRLLLHDPRYVVYVHGPTSTGTW